MQVLCKKMKGNKMNVSFNPAISTNSKQNNIQFKGVRGDKIVGDIIRGAEVKPDSVIKEIKGTFGIKTDKATDILESFIEKIKTLFKEKTDYSKRLNEAEEKIREFPREKQNAVRTAEDELRKYYQSIIDSKNRKLTEREKELQEAKDFAAKYEPMTKVKSINEIDVIMPERAKEILNEVIENKVPAYKSMENFLFEGKGQEEALKQLDRFMELSKAQIDGIFNIPEMSNLLNTAQREHHIYISNEPLFNMQNMIERTLSDTKKADYLESKTIREQVKKNAMALLTPHANNKYANTTVEAVERYIDKTINKTIEFSRGFAKGIEKIKKDFKGKVEFEFQEVPYDKNNSKVLVKPADKKEYITSFYEVADYGNSNWA